MTGALGGNHLNPSFPSQNKGPVPPVPTGSQPVPTEGSCDSGGSPIRLAASAALKAAPKGTGRDGSGHQENNFNPEAPFIPELQHLAPRLSTAWEAIKERLSDGEKHTLASLTAVGVETGIAATTTKDLLRKAIKHGHLQATPPYRRYNRHTTRKVWLPHG